MILLLLMLWESHALYFDYLTPLPFPLKSIPPTQYPPTLCCHSFFLFCFNLWSPIIVTNILLDVWPSIGPYSTHQGFYLEKKTNSPSPAVIIISSSSARGGMSIPGYPSTLRLLSDLNLFKSCGCCHNPCKLICATTLLCSWNNILLCFALFWFFSHPPPLTLTVFPLHLLQWSLNFRRDFFF